MNDILHIIHAKLVRNHFDILASQNRLQNVLEQCNEQNIKFVLVDGVVSEPIIFHNISKSHKSIVRMAKENGMDRVLIAEDDLVFSAPGAWDYFKSQIPKSYDMFFGLILHGTVQDSRVMSAFSGGMTLYSIHSRFYDDFLSMSESEHIDRKLGSTFAESKEFYCCYPMVCRQKGGYSMNLTRQMTYELYEQERDFFKGEG